MKSSASSSPVASFGPFELEFGLYELRKRGRRISLQDQPFQVLAKLLERPGNVVTRDELRQKLWPRDTFVDFDHGLNNAINRLRDALNDSADTPRFIQTLPKRGYRFISQVESHADETGSATAQGALLPWWRSQWAAFGTTAFVLSLLLGCVPSASKGMNSTGAHCLRIASVAMLPLEIVRGSATQDYLAE